MVDSNLLPQRLRESSFRRFEATIRSIVDAYPGCVTVNPGSLSMLTVVGRLRDAMASLHQYKWNTDIDMVKFNENYRNIIVSHRGASILAGGREAVRQFDPLKPITTTEPTTTSFQEPSPSEVLYLTYKEIQFCCRLAARGLLGRPLRFTCLTSDEDAGIGDEDISTLEDSYDVRIDKNNDATFTLS